MNAWLLLAVILLPIIGGVAVYTLKDRNDLHFVTMFLVLATSLGVWFLIFSVDETQSYELLRFTDQLVFKLSFDRLGKFFAGIVSALYPLTTLYAYEYLEHDEEQNGFFLFFLIAYGVTIGVTMSADFFTLYCFYEMLTLSTMPLVLHEKNKQSVRAARTYLYLSIGGASLAFASMVYVTACNNVLEKTALTQLFYLVGFFGFGVKAAIFPVHYWLPKASVAPTPVTALLHAVAVVKAGVFAIIRLTYCIYGTELLRGTFAQYIAIGFAIFTIFFGTAKAVKETHFKRRMAYSTVANLSYILFGVLLMNTQGLTAGLLHMAFHAEMKILLFFSVGSVMHHTGREYIYEIDGIGRKMPVTFLCYLTGALALTGIPPFSGFVSKAYLLMAGIADGTAIGITGTVVLLISALLTAIYTLTTARRAFFPDKNSDLSGIDEIHECGWRMRTVMIVLACGILVTGLCAGSIASSAASAAEMISRWL